MSYNQRSPTYRNFTLDGDNACPRCSRKLSIQIVKGEDRRHPVGTQYLVVCSCSLIIIWYISLSPQCFCWGRGWWYFFPVDGKNNSSLPSCRSREVTASTHNQSEHKAQAIKSPDKPFFQNCSISVRFVHYIVQASPRFLPFTSSKFFADRCQKQQLKYGGRGSTQLPQCR